MLCMIISMVDSPEDKRKVEKLYNMYNALMFSVARKILNINEDVEDAVISSWEKIIRNLDKIHEIDCNETKSFIVIITERTAIDVYRRLKKNKNVSIDDLEASPYLKTRETAIDEFETVAWLRTMPKKYSEVLILFYVNECKSSEIAKILGVKENTVNVRLSRAREYLRKNCRW